MAGCARAQKLRTPPPSSITAVKLAAAGSAGSTSRGIAASKIAKLLPCRIVLSGSREAGRRLGLRPVARIRALGEAADHHVLQLTAGPVAMGKALDRAGMALGEVGVGEFMEAFAAVPVLFARDFGFDPERLNPNGGHLAMGHPMGATGAILTTTLLDDMAQFDVDTGLVMATGGVGVGAAMVLERAG